MSVHLHSLSQPATTAGAVQAGRLETLRHLIDHAAHLLPAQGPITVFIHHNTLHALEDLPFEEAVRHGAEVFGCEPYLGEDRYREALARGRIRFAGLRRVVKDDLGARAAERVVRTTTLYELRLAMLQYPLYSGPAEELRWFMAETDALRRFRPEVSAVIRGRLIAETRRWVMRDLRVGVEGGRGRPQPAWAMDLVEECGSSAIESWPVEEWEAFTLRALWQACRVGVRDLPGPLPAAPPLRHRDLMLAATGVDTDLAVHDVLIRLCSAFLDQGVAHWRLPGREHGFFQAFCTLYRSHRGVPDVWLRGLSAELDRLQDGRISPLECIQESLRLLGVPEDEWQAFLSATLLALRGWAGMVRQVELRGDRVAHPAPPGSLDEFLAVRLLLERFALAAAGREALAYHGPLAGLRKELRRLLPSPVAPGEEQRAFPLFQLAQIIGWTPEELAHQTATEWSALAGHIEAFSSVERRRLFHLTYERRFHIQALDALALHPRHQVGAAQRPRFQAICCLDDREESFRRHLEEVAPDCETFGVAGFFGVAIYYRGVTDAHFVPLCPVVVRPNHWVEEQVGDGLEEEHRLRTRTRRVLGALLHQIRAATRGLASGAVLATGLGVLASVPLVLRILFPRLTARTHRLLGRFVRTPRHTWLKLERSEAASGLEERQLGYSVDEMADLGEYLLRDIGLTERYARLVFVVGHGSDSLNNPHKSAYDCGACGGAPGGPNARAMARMLNDPRVREQLARRDLAVPSDTVFVACYHNTCDDALTLYEPERIPPSHADEFAAACHDLKETRRRNAHERCRRFQSAPLTLSFPEALHHVEERSEDLAQTRPELGHATNALCVVGRRERTRGLFLDRRAFLASYDPLADDVEGTVLTRILQAAVPVCAGINLEYYFSRVDSPGWGSGSKLPHNITALLGVMDGAASDLRTGLPWQMAEIHEPVRLLFIVEASPELLTRLFARHENIGRLVAHEWVLFASLDPAANTLQVWRDGAFHPYQVQATHLPAAESSTDWYRGWRDHLEFAEIVP